jgi:excisionase family DNA binding protein
MKVDLPSAPALDVQALPPLATKREVADFLGCGVAYLNDLMRRGELGYYKRGTARQASVRIGRSHVEALLRAMEQ